MVDPCADDVFMVKIAPFALGPIQALKVLSSARAPEGTVRSDLTYAVAYRPAFWFLPEGLVYRAKHFEQAKQDIEQCDAVSVDRLATTATIKSRGVPRALPIEGEPDFMLVCVGAAGIQDLDRSLCSACKATNCPVSTLKDKEVSHVWEPKALSDFLQRLRGTAPIADISEVAMLCKTTKGGAALVREDEFEKHLAGMRVGCIALEQYEPKKFRVARSYMPPMVDEVFFFCDGVAWWGNRPLPGHPNSHRISLRCFAGAGVQLVPVDITEETRFASELHGSSFYDRTPAKDVDPIQPIQSDRAHPMPGSTEDPESANLRKATVALLAAEKAEMETCEAVVENIEGLYPRDREAGEPTPYVIEPSCLMDDSRLNSEISIFEGQVVAQEVAIKPQPGPFAPWAVDSNQRVARLNLMWTSLVSLLAPNQKKLVLDAYGSKLPLFISVYPGDEVSIVHAAQIGGKNRKHVRISIGDNNLYDPPRVWTEEVRASIMALAYLSGRGYSHLIMAGSFCSVVHLAKEGESVEFPISDMRMLTNHLVTLARFRGENFGGWHASHAGAKHVIYV
uniref:Uncharacterized protein n=1 Tax=viral metagenome TaxID=1070528 RepID=A0A2V0RI05_9ZZZZ